MGCCSSRQSADPDANQGSGGPEVAENGSQMGAISGGQNANQRVPGSSGGDRRGSSSRHGGNASSSRGGGDGTGGSSGGTGSRGRSKGSKLKARINKPLKRHVWSAPAHQQPRPTVQGLARQRLEFFETRVTGKQEVWNALRLAIEAMQEPGSQALQLAQEIVNAADVTLPAGDLIGGAYDVFGNFYEFPEYVLSDPINALNDPEPNDDDLDIDGEISKENMDDDTLERRRKEKGKAVANATPLEDEREETLRIRLSNGSDHSMKFTTSETVASIKRRVMETAGLNPASEELRIVQMGKILDDHRSLFKQGWNKNNMLLGMIVPPSAQTNQPRAQAPPAFANERSGP